MLNIYPTLSLSHFRATAEVLRRTLFGITKDAEEKGLRSFDIFADGSYLYTDKANLDIMHLQRPTLTNESQAIEAGRQALVRLQTAADYKPIGDILGGNGVQLMPKGVFFDRVERIFLDEIKLGANGPKALWHWRLHYKLKLRPDSTTEPVEVQGAKLEIDLTWGGAPLRIYSTILPIYSPMKRKRLPLADLDKLEDMLKGIKGANSSDGPAPVMLTMGGNNDEEVSDVSQLEMPLLKVTHYRYYEGKYTAMVKESGRYVGAVEYVESKGGEDAAFRVVFKNVIEQETKFAWDEWTLDHAKKLSKYYDPRFSTSQFLPKTSDDDFDMAYEVINVGGKKYHVPETFIGFEQTMKVGIFLYEHDNTTFYKPETINPIYYEKIAGVELSYNNKPLDVVELKQKTYYYLDATAIQNSKSAYLTIKIGIIFKEKYKLVALNSDFNAVGQINLSDNEEFRVPLKFVLPIPKTEKTDESIRSIMSFFDKREVISSIVKAYKMLGISFIVDKADEDYLIEIFEFDIGEDNSYHFENLKNPIKTKDYSAFFKKIKETYDGVKRLESGMLVFVTNILAENSLGQKIGGCSQTFPFENRYSIVFGDSINNPPSYIHELGHALGLAHTFEGEVTYVSEATGMEYTDEHQIKEELLNLESILKVYKRNIWRLENQKNMWGVLSGENEKELADTKLKASNVEKNIEILKYKLSRIHYSCRAGNRYVFGSEENKMVTYNFMSYSFFKSFFFHYQWETIRCDAKKYL